MQLTYRGIKYDTSAPAIQVTETEESDTKEEVSSDFWCDSNDNDVCVS